MRRQPADTWVDFGAQYIGAHVVRALLRQVEPRPEVIVVDNLSSGHESSLAAHEADGGVRFVRGDVREAAVLDEAFSKFGQVDAVCHLCASIEVGESVADPLKYYNNNVGGAVALLEGMRRHGVKQMIFSSTAAVFGIPGAEHIPLRETSPHHTPVNPYGETKLVVERLLASCETAYGMRSVVLRYFNACGADPKGDLGEAHDPESHLIPIVLQAASGDRDSVAVFGGDYDTSSSGRAGDGSCVRDYVHVSDLATAHVQALAYLGRGGAGDAFNLGNGTGFSVREVIAAVRRVTGRDFTVREAARRAGDPPVLIAASDRARATLGWTPAHDTLDGIVEDAWRWHQRGDKA